MHDQRVERRPALGGEDARDRPVVGRVAAEAVDRLGRERDEAACGEDRAAAGDAPRRRGRGSVRGMALADVPRFFVTWRSGGRGAGAAPHPARYSSARRPLAAPCAPSPPTRRNPCPTAPRIHEYRHLLDDVPGFRPGRRDRALRRRHARHGGRDPDRGRRGSARRCWRRCSATATPTRRGWRTGSCAPRRASPRATAPSPRAAGSALAASPEYGGMGLPQTLATCVNEMMSSACLALQLNPLMTPGPDRGAGAPRLGRAPGALPAQAGLGRMVRHDEPDRAAGGQRRRRAQERGPSRTATAPMRSPGRRSSSPGPTTTLPATSATWCWRGCPTGRRGPRASASSWCRSACPTRRASRARPTASGS